MRPVAALAAGLLGWSVVGNLAVGDALYVPRNLVLTAGLLGAARWGGLRWCELGLVRDRLPAGWRWGAGSAAAVGAVVLGGTALADRLGPVTALLADERAALAAGPLAAAVLVRIPLGTALFEEVAFRGVLLAAWRRHRSTLAAVVGSSAVFGLWHLAPTAVTLRLNGVPPSSGAGLKAMVGAVVVTTAAGAAFAALRLRSDSLVAPVLAHWATNAAGLLAAATTR